VLVSPAEPAELRKLGTVSSVTERYGADFIVISPIFGRVGIQRKEIHDLIASIGDGRVEREIWQQKALDQIIWIIEGEPRWSSDGSLLSSRISSYTKSMHLGVVLSLYSHGYWILNSSSLTDTIELLSALNRWLLKKSHTSLLRRPSIRTSFGVSLADEQIHVMQGFPKMGYERSKKIVEQFEGLPFAVVEDLRGVDGIGDKIAGDVERIVGRKARKVRRRG
jgi:ERCC4-type nuclease